MSETPTVLYLTPKEAQALFRALCEYRVILLRSDVFDTPIVKDEILLVDAVSERISLNFYYPAGDRNVVGA